MSEIKVNKITPRAACGTTQLGDSGDTFTIPSGATITNAGTASGFGATGETSWDTTVKTTGTFTATAGVGYFLNTTGGIITVNLPAGAAGSSVALADYAGTWQTNNVTVSPNGSEFIGGVNADVTLSTEGQSVTFVYIDGTQGWVNVIDSTSNVRANAFIVATGGTPCTGAIVCTDYKTHTFTGPGTFTVCAVSTTSAENIVSYLVVAGGGNGGNGVDNTGAGSGGGAGGFREYKGPADCYTASPKNGNPGGTAVTVTATGYPITVGAGGTSNPDSAQRGTNGANSIFSTITGAGGGAGGSGNDGAPLADAGPNPGPDRRGGVTGGSGGGSRSGPGPTYAPSPYGAPGIAVGDTPSVTPPQGNPGTMTTPPAGGGGGGGATATGGAGSNDGNEKGGVGGAGATTSITGSPVAYGGGGGGSGYAGIGSVTQAPGGLGGGGSGSYCVSASGGGYSGTANTGGAGGGGIGVPGSGVQPGGAGGSGIVVIRYKFQ